MGDEVVIKTEGVYKDFKLDHEKSTTLKSRFTNILKGKKNRTTEVQHALKNINLEVKKGEFLGVVGRNGGGKSPLLKILAEIYQPTKGNVHVVGKLVPFIELGVGFNPELTGRENVYLNGAILGFSKKEIDEFYSEVVEFAELGKFMDKKLKNYSSGMQVRLAFSMAIRAKADILLIDEVLAVGDADFQRKCFDYFKSLKKSNQTVVFVTHDMEAVREYCDRAMLIQDSVVTHEGVPEKVADEYTKLFNKAATGDHLEGQDRWGNQEIYFSKLSVNRTDDKVTINAHLQSTDAAHDGVVVGVGVYDAEGKLVAGTSSTRLLDGRKLNFVANEKKHLSFELDNIFGKGTHTITATIKLSDKVTVCDNWANAARFQNAKRNTYYPVLAPAKLEVKPTNTT